VILWDERLTTWEAERLLREAQAKRQRRRELIDAIAAQVLLRSYLEAGAPDQGIA
jgi:putative Holliday junction resolvase